MRQNRSISFADRLFATTLLKFAPSPLTELGWKSLGVLELTALPSLGQDRWVPLVRETDALLVYGGDSLYLCHWMRESGLADLLPELSDTVYVGVSSGSMVLTPSFGTRYDDWFAREPPAPPSNLPVADDRALGLVDFSIFPHVDIPQSPQNSMPSTIPSASHHDRILCGSDRLSLMRAARGQRRYESVELVEPCLCSATLR